MIRRRLVGSQLCRLQPFGISLKERPKFRNLHSSTSLVDSNDEIDKIFTPVGFSTSNLIQTYTRNLNNIEETRNISHSKIINHVKSINKFSQQNSNINSGSLAYIKSNDIFNCFGIVLDDYKLSLSSHVSQRILLPNGEVKNCYHDEIIFAIPDFITRESMLSILHDDPDIFSNQVKPIIETLNVFMLLMITTINTILSKDLIRTIYLKTAFTNYQSALHISTFANQMYNESKSLRNFLNITHNPFSYYTLMMSCQFLVYNDPIHFRKVEVKTPIFNTLNPLTQVTTSYFNNPIILSQNIENLYNQPNELIRKSYRGILERSDPFQIYNVWKTDENFKKLILLIKYAIIYPHSKLLKKLRNILPSKITISPKSLVDFLIELGIYEKGTNFILASGIYGLNSRDIDDISLMPNKMKDLQYSLYSDMKVEKIPLNLSRYNPFAPKLTEERVDFRKGYSEEFLDILNDVKSNIWENKGKSRSKLYKLTDQLAFSVEQITMTEYTFNFLVPIPNQAPNENISIQEPIRVTKNLSTFPKIPRLNNALRVNQPCIKITLTHNLIDSNSLTSPRIKVGLDVFRKIELIDDQWFENRNVPHFENSRKKLDCWLSMNKLFNLIQEKEKSRIRLGLLKTFGNSDEKDEVLKTFKRNFSDNLQQDEERKDRNFSYPKDKEWVLENLRFLIDECLARFCVEKKINIASRSLITNTNKSIDFRVFKKFKIFKWYADSYDTFNFQLSSNPGDLTAYVNCLQFLGKCRIIFNNWGKKQREYQPLGLEYYASFTRYEFIETHLNQWQLLRYLLVNSFEFIRDKENKKWDPRKLDVVTQDHYNKYLSQSEGYLELVNRMNRYEKLKEIEKEINEGTDFEIIRCIVMKISKEKKIGYWIDKNIEVEIDTEKNVSIGDRLLCSEVYLCDCISDVCIVR
ncbi:hypothetical protein CANINC_000254 [Pichia inconspicua]|uniref:Uncharacterized protein n=1 Tax=Pichia inconspicua TaxID=52247 RepID=A0A4T0X6J8_9ASCO|nr:hypothetical protein CANINC_000254 [[Candida] inconspicua]